MKNNIVILGHKDLSEHNDKIINELSKYIEIFIGEDKSVNYKEVETNYLLENNSWHVDFFYHIAHLKEQYDRYEMRARSKNIHFNFNNLNLNREIKYLFQQKIVSNEWSISYSIVTQSRYNKTAKVNSINFTVIKNKYLDLKRADILNYYEYLNKYIEENLTNRNSNPNTYKITAISNINRFLCDIQLKDFSIAPSEDIRKLIYKEDKPSREKKEASKIDYVPDFVLEQLFDNINGLYKDTVPIVWIMYKIRLRISDVLGLKFDCLIKLNNKFWIETDIEKTYIKDHRIPIDNDLANMLAVLIHNGKQISNKYNNPEELIFVRYSGKRKGIPYLSSHVQSNLNRFARKYSIKDEDGEIFYFKNHAFRHIYAIKMLNGGADILTVQELLAHASPEMTMRYAKLLDDTKRKVFDNAVKQGVFSFDESAKLKEENSGEIPSDIIDMLYTNHKLNALDTPYGTCMQRKNGKCSYTKQPPCLTCNKRKALTQEKVDKAIQRLIRSQKSINFNSVASESRITKKTLYDNKEIRERIETLRQQQSQVPTPSQVKREMSENNKDAVIASLKRKIKRLEEENKELREQIKINYAEIYN